MDATEKLDVTQLDSIDIRDITDENASQATAVTSYLYIIQKIKSAALESGQGGMFFYRGQADEKSWRVNPSVFRENQLGSEHMLISEAIRRSPGELANGLTKFERLTKLQHYELPTRLLDVTENPLIALYFACSQENEVDGAVFAACTYPIYADSLEVQILSHIAHIDTNGMTLKMLWESLKKDGLDIPGAENVPDIDTYINIIKHNYFVKSNLDNLRIKQQSGAFLLSGCVNAMPQDSIWDSTLEKTDKCLAAEFDHKIIIPAEMKEELLAEMDMYNINEGSVYPELDHQMRYIRQKSKYGAFASGGAASQGDVGAVVKCTRSADFAPNAPNYLPPQALREIIAGYVHDADLAEGVYAIFAKGAKLDWPVKMQLKAGISSGINRYLTAQKYSDKAKCQEIAELILHKALSISDFPAAD